MKKSEKYNSIAKALTGSSVTALLISFITALHELLSSNLEVNAFNLEIGLAAFAALGLGAFAFSMRSLSLGAKEYSETTTNEAMALMKTHSAEELAESQSRINSHLQIAYDDFIAWARAQDQVKKIGRNFNKVVLANLLAEGNGIGVNGVNDSCAGLSINVALDQINKEISESYDRYCDLLKASRILDTANEFAAIGHNTDGKNISVVDSAIAEEEYRNGLETAEFFEDRAFYGKKLSSIPQAILDTFTDDNPGETPQLAVMGSEN